MTTNKNTFCKLFPYTDKEIRFLAADASSLEVSKFDTHLSYNVSPKSVNLAYREGLQLRFILGRAYFLLYGKTLQPNE